MFVPNVWWGLLIITPFFAIFNGLSQANLSALVSRSVGPQMQGQILGMNSSVQALGQTIPPILSGFLAAGIAARAPIVVSGITIIFAGCVFIYFVKNTLGRY
jgi:MFS family permease